MSKLYHVRNSTGRVTETSRIEISQAAIGDLLKIVHGKRAKTPPRSSTDFIVEPFPIRERVPVLPGFTKRVPNRSCRP